jgi:branched-chain amino acid transport system substrate-binding protein
MNKRKAVAAALPLMLLVAACGSSSSSGGALIISSDLPWRGASSDASPDTNKALELYLKQQGGKAGKYKIELKKYDDSTAAKGSWDDATCAKNANDHVANAKEVAVMGTYNSGCAKIIVPTLNKDPKGPMLMISHANTNPGLTKTWDPGEPDKFYPTKVRNYGRVVATDDFQGAAGAQMAAKDLGVKKCVVLNDTQTYGVGVATAFKTAAKAVGIEVVADQGWDGKQPNYTAMFEGFKKLNPDCVYLGGINDNNGEQLIRDKFTVLGDNTKVKLITPDGFTGYPSLLKLTEADGMYVTFAGLPADELVKAGGAGGKFVTDFKAAYGKDPASAYAIYGAAAMQLIMKAVAASDGTRKDITAKALGGVTITAQESLIGKAFSLDANGDITVRDMSVQQIKGGKEVFIKPWPVG